MAVPDLSTQQSEMLKSGVRLLEACPGAGKTRAVVARFMQEAAAQDKGVALLSFTNAAIDEARGRCSNDPTWLRPPNFVGTFDTFVHRYIVTPDVTAQTGKSPGYFQSWDELDGETRIRVYKRPGAGVALSKFMHDTSGGIDLVSSALPNDQRAYYSGLNPAEQQKLIRTGAGQIRGLNKSGMYDSDSARAQALAIIKSARGEARLAKLHGRFAEVIVDEFQDCSSMEHDILDALRCVGISVVVVADPDQAIYGFRQASPGLYDAFRTSVPDQSVVSLNENFRSSPVICSLVGSLAGASGRVVVASGGDKHADSPTAIYLVAGDHASVLARFEALCADAEIGVEDRVVLAYSGASARKLASGSLVEPTGAGFMKRLLIYVARLSHSRSVDIRKNAMTGLAGLLLSQLDWPAADARSNSKRKLELLGRRSSWMRSIIGELVRTGATWDSRQDCRTSIKGLLEAQLGHESVPLSDSFVNCVKVGEDLWAFWAASASHAQSQTAIRWSTIHGVKGQEFGAVLLDAPNPSTMADWQEGRASEDRRVFYVGASRAGRLIVLHVPRSRLKATSALFTLKGISSVAEELPA